MRRRNFFGALAGIFGGVTIIAKTGVPEIPGDKIEEEPSNIVKWDGNGSGIFVPFSPDMIECSGVIPHNDWQGFIV
jgi:hypothetical protein